MRKILLALSNSGVEYSQGMNYILVNVIIYCLESIGIGEAGIDEMPLNLERDIFIILREIVLRLDEVFENNNIFKVMAELEEKITETVPDVMYHMYKMGMDSFSLFSQHYFSLLTYSDPPE